MKMFTTTVELPVFSQKITLHTPILSLGSCFADTMGQKLTQNKFQVWNNPFGVIFNPFSIYKVLEVSLKNTIFNSDRITQNNEVWSHYDLHSKLSALSKNQLLENVKLAQRQTQQFFDKVTQNEHPSFLILTFGTAYVYQLKEQQSYVANCHKMPSHFFEKKLLSIQEIVDGFIPIYALLASKNIHIILTVSPVRHIKETLSKNQVSKSILKVASHEIEQNYKNVTYFPAYEIMMDELRDYRFYAPDLIHPNDTATQYIFDKFSEVLFDDDTQKFIQKWTKIRQALQHRPQFEHSVAYQKFLQNLLEKVQNITEVNTQSEIKQIEEKIRSLKMNKLMMY